MVNIFITDSRDKYNQSKYPDKILYRNGFIGESSFIDKLDIDAFNNSLIGLEDEANRLMLEKLDQDTELIIKKNLNFGANRFIAKLPPKEKIHSLLLNLHKTFVTNKYLFQLVFDRFYTYFSIHDGAMILLLSEHYYLTQDITHNVKSASYYNAHKNAYLKFLFKQVYYFIYHMVFPKKTTKTDIAVFLLDQPNEFDVIKKYIQLISEQGKYNMTIAFIDNGTPIDKRADASNYISDNINVTYLHYHKGRLNTNYNDFYSVCKEINPLYRIYKRARICESLDVQYGFMNNVIMSCSPHVCLYMNTQEHGRIMANVCAYYNIPSICVDYSLFFDTYNIEKRIKFDVRACISDVSVSNWEKHKDPTPRHVVTGFCKIDDWHEKLIKRQQSDKDKPFDNNKLTILFASTWAPNPNSPLLMEKVKIIEQLSEMCTQNDWNLIIKKHPSEFDNLISDYFHENISTNVKIVEHHEMSLFECIYFSDFVCTQNSTAFIEALYLNKPFSYLSVIGENVWANMSSFSKEKQVGTFGSIKEYEQYIIANTKDENSYLKLCVAFQDLQIKYLYKIDGKASERLLALTQTFLP